ncbi:TPA: phage terminase large subunit [Klebsiella pneumoniae]|nr:phage terminase large subunit [Klebsiella pneumoniae]
MSQVDIQIPDKLVPVFTAEGKRYRGSHGGRGSAKTRTFAKMSAVKAYQYAECGISGVIVCGREFMNSLEESSMEEVKQAIRETPFLNDYFDIGEKYIRTKNRLVSYVFCGLRHNLDSIKSKARILLAWVDEAESVSDTAWNKLDPTVREEGVFADGSPWASEIWVTWNPERDGSATDKRFRKNLPDNAVMAEMNYSDNPWFPEVLEQVRQNDLRRMDYATYAWVWEGAYLENSDKQVLAGKYRVAEFSDDLWKEADRLFFGADFGFAQDPSTLIRSFILGNALYIEYEAYGTHVELDHLPAFYDKIPGSRKWPIHGDCSRPETISYLSRQGFIIDGATKWSGSVEDGITYLRGFDEIVIHPRCKHTAEEARLYSYKTDRITGEILPVIVDADNHCWDAIRYGLDGYITSEGDLGVWAALGKQQ